MSKNTEPFLNKKRILFFSQFFMGYETIIFDGMKSCGAEVKLYDERSIKSKIAKALFKFFPSLFSFHSNAYYKKILQEEKNNTYDFIVFIDCDMVSERTLTSFKKVFSKSAFLLYVWDSFSNLRGIKKKLRYFDRCATFDSVDAHEYGLHFRPLFFPNNYNVKITKNLEKPSNDLFFCGTIHSDRYDILNRINKKYGECYQIEYYPYLQSSFVYWFYKLTKKSFSKAKKEDFMFLKASPETIIGSVRKSKCIIDIQHPLQNGLTFRTLEMLALGKKLVTTNKEIKTYDFYNPNNILVIDRKNPIIPKEFIDAEYESIDETVLERYTLIQWLKDLFEIN